MFVSHNTKAIPVSLKMLLLHKIADVLDVSFYALYEPDMYCAEDVMYTLFDQDDQHPGIRLVDVLMTVDLSSPKNASLLFMIMTVWKTI